MSDVLPLKISSKYNPKFKTLLSLLESKGRKKSGLFLVEGMREIERALVSGYELDHWMVADSEKGDQAFEILSKLTSKPCYVLSQPLFKQLVYRDEVVNAIAAFHVKQKPLNELVLPNNPLILVLDGLEKPGNLGAILRSCDAAGAHAVLITRPQTDLFNPNLIRASLGCFFSQQIACATENEVFEFLTERNISIYATYFDDAVDAFELDYSKGTAFVLGGEAFGISEFWVKNNTKKVMLPMLGIADSLNVSTCTAVLLYEALRQRR
jgi:TrmH family RNA methyltransferase